MVQIMGKSPESKIDFNSLTPEQQAELMRAYQTSQQGAQERLFKGETDGEPVKAFQSVTPTVEEGGSTKGNSNTGVVEMASKMPEGYVVPKEVIQATLSKFISGGELPRGVNGPDYYEVMNMLEKQDDN